MPTMSASSLLLLCCISFASLSVIIHSQMATAGPLLLSPLADFITGPHYVSPLPVEAVVRTGFPAAIKSTCDAGDVYTITSNADLIASTEKLECIYNAGQAPNTVPLGIHYGTVLKFGTTDSLTQLLMPFWKGKIVSQIRCPNSVMFLGLNVVQNRLRVATSLSIGISDIKLAPGEYTDNEPALILDYTVKLGDMCNPPTGSMFNQSDLSFDFLENLYPFRLVVDVVRVVGRQVDGGVIYLGKTYVQDPFRYDRQAYNLAWWSIVNYDPMVTTLKPGESLAPLETTFSYAEPGAFQAFRLMFPFDNLVVDPLTTLERFIGYSEAFAKAIYQRSKLDISRAVARAPTIHYKTLASGIEFLIFKISWILSRSSSLSIAGAAPDSLANALLEFTSSEVSPLSEVVATVDGSRTAADTKIRRSGGNQPAVEDSANLLNQQQPQQQQQKITSGGLLEILGFVLKAFTRTTETLGGEIDNNLSNKEDAAAKATKGLSNVLQLANNLQKLLNSFEKSPESQFL